MAFISSVENGWQTKTKKSFQTSLPWGLLAAILRACSFMLWVSDLLCRAFSLSFFVSRSLSLALSLTLSLSLSLHTYTYIYIYTCYPPKDPPKFNVIRDIVGYFHPHNS